MTGEKCFFPRLKKKLKPGLQVYAYFLVGGLLPIAFVYGLDWLLSTQPWAITAGNTFAFGIAEFLSLILSNFTLVLGMIYAAVLVWAYFRLKECKKRTVYSALATFWLPAGLTYLLIRVLFWTHLWVYNGKTADAGMWGVTIAIVAFFTIMGLCSAVKKTVCECFVDAPVEAKTK